MKIATSHAKHDNMRNRRHINILLDLWLYRMNVYLEERLQKAPISPWLTDII